MRIEIMIARRLLATHLLTWTARTSHPPTVPSLPIVVQALVKVIIVLLLWLQLQNRQKGLYA